jgi:hypothetical protein
MRKTPIEHSVDVVMPKAHLKFETLNKYFHINNNHFVIRGKDNMVRKGLESGEDNQKVFLISDKTKRLSALTKFKKRPDANSLVPFADFSTNL